MTIFTMWKCIANGDDEPFEYLDSLKTIYDNIWKYNAS